MKQRFSSLDVKVIAHELSTSLVSLRLSNIYDLSSKILLLKFAKPEDKKQLLIDSGFRCHLTDFARTTAAAPSVFVQKLRKALKTRRVTKISQIGTDRIIEFQFSDGMYRLYLEFFASGNVILTDSELKIVTLLRHVPEGEGQEPQRPGLPYSLDNRQNFGGVPELTKERVRAALETTIEKAAVAAASGKKIKKKPGDELRKGLATTIVEIPPILVDHVFKVTKFDSTAQPAAVLENEELLEHLFRSLQEARKIVGDITSSASCKGYIFAKKRPGAPEETSTEAGSEPKDKGKGLLYEDFHPFLPRQFEEDPSYSVVTFENFNKMVDEFFSSIEGQRLESKLSEREAAAKQKLEAARADQNQRLEGLKQTQQLNVRKAGAIEANIEMANLLVKSGLDFVTANLLDAGEGFRHMQVTEAGASFPYYSRHMSGITEAYAIFTYPSEQYPDLIQFLEAIPDISLFININNDMLSFYKEEVAGESTNYIHNRARCERKDPLTVVREVKQEVVDCVRRVNRILEGREPYLQAWKIHMTGHVAMHTVNPRYWLVELGLGEEHPSQWQNESRSVVWRPGLLAYDDDDTVRYDYMRPLKRRRMEKGEKKGAAVRLVSWPELNSRVFDSLLGLGNNKARPLDSLR